MKKFVTMIILLLGITAILSGCSSTKLVDSFDKDTVESTAKQVIELLNNQEYDSVFGMFHDDLQKKVTVEELRSAVNKTYADAGAFDSYKNVVILGQKVKLTGEDSAVAVIVAKYENQKVTFTLSFDTDMKMIGIFMK